MGVMGDYDEDCKGLKPKDCLCVKCCSDATGLTIPEVKPLPKKMRDALEEYDYDAPLKDCKGEKPKGCDCLNCRLDSYLPIKHYDDLGGMFPQDDVDVELASEIVPHHVYASNLLGKFAMKKAEIDSAEVETEPMALPVEQFVPTFFKDSNRVILTKSTRHGKTSIMKKLFEKHKHEFANDYIHLHEDAPQFKTYGEKGIAIHEKIEEIMKKNQHERNMSIPLGRDMSGEMISLHSYQKDALDEMMSRKVGYMDSDMAYKRNLGQQRTGMTSLPAYMSTGLATLGVGTMLMGGLLGGMNKMFGNNEISAKGLAKEMMQGATEGIMATIETRNFDIKELEEKNRDLENDLKVAHEQRDKAENRYNELCGFLEDMREKVKHAESELNKVSKESKLAKKKVAKKKTPTRRQANKGVSISKHKFTTKKSVKKKVAKKKKA